MILESPSLRLQVEPACGGGLARFDWIGSGAPVALMRAFESDAASSIPDPNRLACYPLIPWSGRVSGGGFRVGERRVELPLNRDDEPWPIHGSGWQRAWRVERASASEAMLMLDDAIADAYRYRAALHYRLDDATLHVSLSATNTGAAAMPFGLGLHPFFPKHGDARLCAPASGIWHNDGRTPLPVARTSVPAQWDFAREASLPEGLDNPFDGWNGRATIHWPQRKLRLEIAADVDRYVVYVPARQDFFCFEPVDHAADAVNLPGGAAANGMTMLAPDETLTRQFSFRAISL
jgi:aldose 1-epimerase